MQVERKNAYGDSYIMINAVFKMVAFFYGLFETNLFKATK